MSRDVDCSAASEDEQFYTVYLCRMYWRKYAIGCVCLSQNETFWKFVDDINSAVHEHEGSCALGSETAG